MNKYISKKSMKLLWSKGGKTTTKIKIELKLHVKVEAILKYNKISGGETRNMKIRIKSHMVWYSLAQSHQQKCGKNTSSINWTTFLKEALAAQNF